MRRALITGGSGGIGSAIARQLAKDGFHVYIHANQGLDKALSLKKDIEEKGGSATALAFDITDTEASQESIIKVLDEGPIQVLVNNAGIHDDAVFPGMSASQWQRVIDVSLKGFFNVTQPLMLPMIRTRWGRIVNMSSLSGIAGNRGQVNYSAAKGAINSATRALALEVASRGITVNAVAPGIIQTDAIKDSFNTQTIEQMVPMKRAGQPEEVADLVGFLCSEKAAYITGQVISINGGIL